MVRAYVRLYDKVDAKLGTSIGCVNVYGLGCHFSHLIRDTLTPLVRFKLENPEIETVYLQTHPSYSKRFLGMIPRLLPFVVTADVPGARYDTVLLAAIHGSKSEKDPEVVRSYQTDLKSLQDYVKTVVVSEKPPGKYVVLINRSVDHTIDRRFGTNGAQRRTIKNFTQLESRVRSACESKGYDLVRVELEHMDIFDQVRLFRHASIVIGQHGAGLANTVWCEDCELVIEYNGTSWFWPFEQFSKRWLRARMCNDNVDIDNTVELLAI